MNYIIIDLEWNNAYNYAKKTGMNEIIEIGAVKLNDSLRIEETFKQLVKPQFSKKISSHCKKLTHITIDELKNGIPFVEAMKDFRRWCGDDFVLLSWSTSDLYALADNFKKLWSIDEITFIKKYADVQKYCQSYIESENTNQISLSNCAEKFGITIEEELHRALADCVLTAKCFKHVYDKDNFKQYIHNCDKDFFCKLLFKSYYISSPVDNGFDLYGLSFECPLCTQPLKVKKDFEFLNNTFCSSGYCKSCKKHFRIAVRAKQNYNEIVISKKIYPLKRKKTRKSNVNIKN